MTIFNYAANTKWTPFLPPPPISIAIYLSRTIVHPQQSKSGLKP